MKLKDKIKSATTEELAEIAASLMLGNGPKLNGQRVICTYNDAKEIITKHRPEIDYADVDEKLAEM